MASNNDAQNIGQSVQEYVKRTAKAIADYNNQIETLGDEKRRYENAPVSRETTVDMMSERITEMADTYEQKIMKPKLHELSMFPSKSKLSERHLIPPGVYDLLVDGSGRDSGSRKIRPDAIAFFFGDLMIEKIKECADETQWPLEFVDGINELDRDKTVSEIDQKIETLRSEKDAIHEELKKVGISI